VAPRLCRSSLATGSKQVMRERAVVLATPPAKTRECRGPKWFTKDCASCSANLPRLARRGPPPALPTRLPSAVGRAGRQAGRQAGYSRTGQRSRPRAQTGCSRQRWTCVYPRAARCSRWCRGVRRRGLALLCAWLQATVTAGRCCGF
jgi:hypothetical protein